MEKRRGNQVMAIAALFIAVIGLSLGFAAFSNTLTIRSSATVTPDDSNFNIDFSNSNSSVVDTYTNTSSETVNGVATVTPSAGTASVAPTVYSHGNIDNTNAPVVSGLDVTFTEPGQYITYDFYTYNAGNLTGYLREMNFVNNTAGYSYITCIAGNKTGTETPDDVTASLLEAACADMKMTVTVNNTATITTTNKNSSASDYHSAGNPTISNASNAHSIATGGAHTVSVKLEYVKDTTANSGAGNYPDGNIVVRFPDVQLIYRSISSVEAAANNG